MVDKTIIYCTANREHEGLAKLVRKTLLEAANGLPIISVSQKPMDFGDNICVGDVGFSNHNKLRQILIGAKKAKTPYIAIAEDDCFYTKEHFRFIPPRENRKKRSYYDTNSWLFHPNKPGFIKAKNIFEGSVIANRKHIISIIRKQMEYRSIWIPKERKEDLTRTKAFKSYGHREFHTEVPIIVVEHINSLHPYGTKAKVKDDYIFNLPFWGNAESLKRKIGL